MSVDRGTVGIWDFGPEELEILGSELFDQDGLLRVPTPSPSEDSSEESHGLDYESADVESEDGGADFDYTNSSNISEESSGSDYTSEDSETVEDEISSENYPNTPESNQPANLDQLVILVLEGEVTGSCTICLNDFKSGEETIRLQCAHQFHKNCIISWFDSNNICPNCRGQATTNSN